MSIAVNMWMHRRIPDEDYLLHEPQKSNKNEKETINK
jgi:hypothetical protein